MTILATTTACGLVFAQEADKIDPKVEDGVAWYDAGLWGVEGKGWQNTRRYYDRLPAEAEGVVRGPVWSLSRHSAGMAVRFETDATAIWARYTLH